MDHGIIPPGQKTQYLASSPTSTDLLEVMSSHDPSEGSKPEESKEVENVQSEAEEKGTEKESKEGNKEAEKADDVLEDAPSASEEKGGDPKSTPESAPAEKVLVASKGDKEISVPEDATFKVRVDGKELDVSISDLKKNYSAKIPWEKHYAESKEREKALDERDAHFTAQKTQIENRWEDILKTFDTNPYLAFEKIAVLKGKNPADYLPIYIAQSRKTIEELSKLSEAEFKALQLKRRTEFEAERLEEDKKKVGEERSQYEKNRQVAEADRYFDGRAKELNFTQQEVEVATRVAQESKLDLSKLTPKEVADLMINYIVQTERPYTRIEKIAHSIDPQLVGNRELIGHLKTLINQDFTDSDIQEILSEYIKDSHPKPGSKGSGSNGVKSSEETSKTGSKKAKGEEGTQKKKAPKAGVNGNDGVGPVSMMDILSEYN